MSRKPALGVPWLSETRKDYYTERIANGERCEVGINDRTLNLPRFLQGKCLKLPWDFKRSNEFHRSTFIADERHERQQYGKYRYEHSNPLTFSDWQEQFPKAERDARMDTLYKEAYVKHLREHLIKI